jgi:hypothetical protein
MTSSGWYLSKTSKWLFDVEKGVFDGDKKGKLQIMKLLGESTLGLEIFLD